MKILIDTCILSELHKNGNQALRSAFIRFQNENLFMSVLTIGEITKGIELLPMGRKRTDLTNWLIEIENDYANRILGIDRDIAFVWGKLSAKTKSSGLNISITDSLIAATALQHGLHVMTRNVKDLVPSGVKIINPFDEVN